MKKFLLVLIIVTVVFFILFKSDSPDEDANIDQTNEKIILKKKQSPKVDTTNASVNPNVVGKLPKKDLPKRTKLPKTEQESLIHHAETLARYVNYDLSQNDLVEELSRLDLKPTESKSTTSLGASNTIRTEKGLKGTRYFHAQFKGDQEGGEVLQHMSFEIRPGAESFANGEAALGKMFKLPAKLKINQKGFKAWPLDNGYIVWVKKLTQKDLDNNPFNAYTKEDVGTIRVAVEIDIHPHGEHGDDDH